MTARHLREEYPDESAAALEQSAAVANLRERVADPLGEPVDDPIRPPMHSPSRADPRRCRVCGQLWAFCLNKWQTVNRGGV